MRVAVTGASGFVGGHVVRALAERAHEVVALVRDPERARALRVRDVVRFDLLAPSDASLSGFDAVVHAAAHKPTNFEDPTEAGRCLEANALATLVLARRAAEAGVASFVYLSAGNAYAPSERPAREDDPLYPSARAPYYLMSKVCGEVFADSAGRRFPSMRVVSLRAAAVYGPGMERRSLVTSVIERLKNREVVDVKAGGTQTADFVFVGDVAQAVASALERPVRGAINIGSGRLATTLEVVQAITTILGSEPSLVRIEPPAASPPPGFPALDIARAREVLAYRPTPLSDGLEACVRALLEPS